MGTTFLRIIIDSDTTAKSTKDTKHCLDKWAVLTPYPQQFSLQSRSLLCISSRAFGWFGQREASTEMSKQYGWRTWSSDDHERSSDDHGRHSYCLDVSVRASRCPNHPGSSDDMHNRDLGFGGRLCATHVLPVALWKTMPTKKRVPRLTPRPLPLTSAIDDSIRVSSWHANHRSLVFNICCLRERPPGSAHLGYQQITTPSRAGLGRLSELCNRKMYPDSCSPCRVGLKHRFFNRKTYRV